MLAYGLGFGVQGFRVKGSGTVSSPLHHLSNLPQPSGRPGTAIFTPP